MGNFCYVCKSSDSDSEISSNGDRITGLNIVSETWEFPGTITELTNQVDKEICNLLSKNKIFNKELEIYQFSTRLDDKYSDDRIWLLLVFNSHINEKHVELMKKINEKYKIGIAMSTDITTLYNHVTTDVKADTDVKTTDVKYTMMSPDVVKLRRHFDKYMSENITYHRNLSTSYVEYSTGELVLVVGLTGKSFIPLGDHVFPPYLEFDGIKYKLKIIESKYLFC